MWTILVPVSVWGGRVLETSESDDCVAEFVAGVGFEEKVPVTERSFFEDAPHELIPVFAGIK